MLHHILSKKDDHSLVQRVDLARAAGQEHVKLLVDLRGFINYIYPKVLSDVSYHGKVSQQILTISGGEYELVDHAVSNFVILHHK